MFKDALKKQNCYWLDFVFNHFSLIYVPGPYLSGCWYLHSFKILGNNNIWHAHWYLTWKAVEKRVVFQKVLMVIDLY